MSANPTILLVEDDVLLREAMRLLLEDAGYDVREAGSAAEALAAVADRPPALVLLDLGLPDRNGLDVARDLAPHDIPVIALTGRAGAGERARCLEAGCCDYFAKPVDPKKLIRELPARIRSGAGRSPA